MPDEVRAKFSYSSY